MGSVLKLTFAVTIAIAIAVAPQTSATPAFDLRSTQEHPLKALRYRDRKSDEDSVRLSGDCGGSEVILRGVKAESWSGWKTPSTLWLDWQASTSLLIRDSGGKTLTIRKWLDEFIQLRCLSTPLGDRLILYISGTGSMWLRVPDNGEWYVIDPQAPVFDRNKDISRAAIKKEFGIQLNKYGDTIGSPSSTPAPTPP